MVIIRVHNNSEGNLPSQPKKSSNGVKTLNFPLTVHTRVVRSMMVFQDEKTSTKEDSKSNLNSILTKSDNSILLPPLVKEQSLQQPPNPQQLTELQPHPQPPSQYDYPINYNYQTPFDPYQQRAQSQQSSVTQQNYAPQYVTQNSFSMPGGSNASSSFSYSSLPEETAQQSQESSNRRGRRFRRRYNQITRRYPCTFPGCSKSYGSLNHLNTHIVTKKHGQRKSKADYQNANRDKDKESNYEQQSQTNQSPQQQPIQQSNLQQQQQQAATYAPEYNYWYGYAPPHIQQRSETNTNFMISNNNLQQQSNPMYYYQSYQQVNVPNQRITTTNYYPPSNQQYLYTPQQQHLQPQPNSSSLTDDQVKSPDDK